VTVAEALRAELPGQLAEATRHQPRAGATLGAALAEPGHAYLFRGPPGSGKAGAARAFAAELLAAGAPDPDDARRRALLDPSPHPDLVWLRPPGAQHLVDEIRESVIRASSLSPAEGERRVFVIEEAEALRDESQNALLKTLEEPAAFTHLILLCAEPELLAGTIVSRCAPVEFAPLAPDAVIEALGGEGDADGQTRQAVARLSGGDVELARMLLSERGRELRASAESAARAALRDAAGGPPWGGLLETAEEAGRDAGAEEEKRLLEQADTTGRKGRSGKLTKDATDQVKRAERRARTQALDLGLSLCCAWYRDLAALSAGAGEVVLNTDRTAELAEDARGIDPARARTAVEWVLETRRRLRLNVSEGLALDALWLRLASTLR
jgi:DNA polymerase-3 subunit delta'